MGEVVKQLYKRFEETRRGVLADLLAQCTDEQRALFGRIYPRGVPKCMIDSAIDLCERTIKKNQAGRKP